MAHLHRCRCCARLFRCEGVDHLKPAWFWCSFQCPDRTLHGFPLVFTLDAEFLQMCDKVIGTEDEEPTERMVPYVRQGRFERRRDLRCGVRAQGQRQPTEVADGEA